MNDEIVHEEAFKIETLLDSDEELTANLRSQTTFRNSLKSRCTLLGRRLSLKFLLSLLNLWLLLIIVIGIITGISPYIYYEYSRSNFFVSSISVVASAIVLLVNNLNRCQKNYLKNLTRFMIFGILMIILMVGMQFAFLVSYYTFSIVPSICVLLWINLEIILVIRITKISDQKSKDALKKRLEFFDIFTGSLMEYNLTVGIMSSLFWIIAIGSVIVIAVIVSFVVIVVPLLSPGSQGILESISQGYCREKELQYLTCNSTSRNSNITELYTTCKVKEEFLSYLLGSSQQSKMQFNTYLKLLTSDVQRSGNIIRRQITGIGVSITERPFWDLFEDIAMNTSFFQIPIQLRNLNLLEYSVKVMNGTSTITQNIYYSPSNGAIYGANTKEVGNFSNCWSYNLTTYSAFISNNINVFHCHTFYPVIPNPNITSYDTPRYIVDDSGTTLEGVYELSLFDFSNFDTFSLWNMISSIAIINTQECFDTLSLGSTILSYGMSALFTVKALIHFYLFSHAQKSGHIINYNTIALKKNLTDSAAEIR